MLHLHRTQYLPNGTRGVLFLPDGTQLHTIELPWRGNASGTLDGGGSCIPEGKYDVEQNRYWNGGYESVEVTPVPERDEIQVHIGNTAADIEGCIAVGLERGTLNGLPAVLYSTEAFEDKFWPRVKHMLPTRMIVDATEEVRPADMAEPAVGNPMKHARQLRV